MDGWMDGLLHLLSRLLSGVKGRETKGPNGVDDTVGGWLDRWMDG